MTDVDCCNRAADADGNDDYDSDFTGVTSPGVDVLTPITESPVDDGYRSANNTTSPRRQGSNTKLTARVSRSVAIVQELIDNVHRVTQENSTSLVEFQKAASDELSVLRARAADGGDTVANICDVSTHCHAESCCVVVCVGRYVCTLIVVVGKGA